MKHILTLLFPFICVSAVAQVADDHWSFYHHSFLDGITVKVRAMAQANNSGNNDYRDLFIGGNFTVDTYSGVGDFTLNHIAHRDKDNLTWDNMDGGMNGQVRALLWSDGVLYAGGDFTTAGGQSANYIAQWDGTNWSALGSGTNAQVYALAADSSGNIYVGGAFSSPGSKVAKWDPVAETWSTLGSGAVGFLNTKVKAMAVNALDRLFIGGDFTSVGGVANTAYSACWTGTTWQNWGVHQGTINAIRIDPSNGNIIYGGDFSSGSSNNIAGITFVTSMLTNPITIGDGVNGPVFSLHIDNNGDIYTGGDFGDASGTTVSNYAKYTANTSTWNNPGEADGVVRTILKYKDDYTTQYLRGGDFENINGAYSPHFYPEHPDGGRNPFQQPSFTTSPDINLLNVNGVLHAASLFETNPDPSFGGSYHLVTYWDEATNQWKRLGNLTPPNGLTDKVLTTSDSAGNIYILASKNIASYLYKWDGANWSSLSTSGLPLSITADAYHSLLIDGNGTLYLNYNYSIYQFPDGSNSWTLMPQYDSKPDEFSNIAIAPDGTLYANAGAFYNSIVHWNGTAWIPLIDQSRGDYSVAPVALAFGTHGRLYGAGTLIRTTGGTSVSHFFYYDFDAQTWVDLGTLSDAPTVNTDIATDNYGNLYIVGELDGAITHSSVEVTVNNIAKYNVHTDTWSPLGSGISNGDVPSIVINNDTVSVYGLQLDLAGATKRGTMINRLDNIAKWSNANPVITVGASENPVTNSSTTLSSSAIDPNGETTSFELWKLVDQPAGSIPSFDTNAANPTVSLDALGDYTFEVTYNDEFGGSATKTIVISKMTDIEAWRFNYFGDKSDTGTGGNSADWNHNGIENLLEFAFGMDPTATNMLLLAVDSPSTFTVGSPTLVSESDQFKFRYIERTDAAGNNLVYTPQSTIDLTEDWGTVSITPVQHAANADYRVMEISFPKTNTLMVRLLVTIEE